jgi:hypothetical protein
MSRAYRIKVRETLRRILRARDGVSTQLELLPILPPEQMAELLAAELQRRGFAPQGKGLARKQGEVTIAVQPETATVAIQAEAAERVQLEGNKEGLMLEEGGSAKATEKGLRRELRKELDQRAQQQTAQLQGRVTEQLEAQLGELRQELDQVVNRVTAEALKRKAAQLGQVKEITEDPQSGSLTITLEV